jgi:hypothetical protein
MIMLLSSNSVINGRRSDGYHADARRAPRWLRRRRGQRRDVARQPGFYRQSSLRPSGIGFLALHRLNDDREIALASLDRFESVDAEVILPAHEDPWTGATARALDVARESL